MSDRAGRGAAGLDLSDRLTPGVRMILIASGLVYLVQVLFGRSGDLLERTLGLVPADLFGRWHLWQPLTYQFLHGGLFHLLFNMIGLFFFGPDVEREWGTSRFLRYYLLCGVGAGLAQWLTDMHGLSPVVGASGSIFGILLAFGMLFPDRTILLWFVVPVPARYVVILFGFLELVAAAGPRDGVARFAHLGGLLTGWLLLTLGPAVDRWTRGVRRGGERLRDRAIDERRRHEQEEVDAILEKIQREGMGSLSDRERNILRGAAKRGREGRR